MSVTRRLTILESLWSLWNLIKEHWAILAVLSGGAGAVIWRLWRYLQVVAMQEGLWIFPAVFLIVGFAALGGFLLFFMLRGDIGFRRVLLSQLRMAQYADVQTLRREFDNLRSSVMSFLADKKRSDPLLKMPSGPDDMRDTWQQNVEKSQRAEKDNEAIFMDRFGARISHLQSQLREAGAKERAWRTPLWAFYQWPESNLQEMEGEVAKIERLHANLDG